MAKIPNNYIYWTFVIKDAIVLKEFYSRGTARQIKEILASVTHMRLKNPDIFNKVKGEAIIKRFKKKKGK